MALFHIKKALYPSRGYGAFVILTKKGPFTRPMKRPKQAEKLQKSPVQKKGCTGDFVISRRRCDGVGGWSRGAGDS